jgi:hypothetical protein
MLRLVMLHAVLAWLRQSHCARLRRRDVHKPSAAATRENADGSGIALATRKPESTSEFTADLPMKLNDDCSRPESNAHDPPRCPVSFHSATLPPWSNVP